MHETKRLLILNNGCRCMLCGKEVPLRELNWHHIVPKSISRRKGQEPDDSYENGSLVCLKCHSYIHSFAYYDTRYQKLMRII